MINENSSSMTTNNKQSPKKSKKKSNALKMPGLGLFMSFKYIFLVIIDIFVLAFKGLKFLCFDIFLLIFSPKHKEEKKTRGEVAEEMEGILNSPQNKRLEQKRLALLNNLQNEGSVRSKEVQVFWYQVRNQNGKLETGTINGYSKLDVNTFLVQEGYTVYEIKTSKMINFLYGDTSIFAVHMSTKDLLFWLTQLSTYIKSGIALTDAVKLLNNQMRKKKNYRKAFQSIIYELTMGEAFSKALEKQGSMFPPLLINMIRAAEATGELEATLTDMANYYEEVEKTRKQMVSAITYPSIITIFAVGVITFILLYVIPQFVKIYQESNVQINGLTLFIINLSNFLQENSVMIGLVWAVVIAILYFCYKKIK